MGNYIEIPANTLILEDLNKVFLNHKNLPDEKFEDDFGGSLEFDDIFCEINGIIEFKTGVREHDFFSESFIKDVLYVLYKHHICFTYA